MQYLRKKARGALAHIHHLFFFSLMVLFFASVSKIMQETNYHEHLICILRLEMNGTKHPNILDVEH